MVVGPGWDPKVHNRHLHLQIATQTEKVFQKIPGRWGRVGWHPWRAPQRRHSVLRVEGADLETLYWCRQEVGALPPEQLPWRDAGGRTRTGKWHCPAAT